MNLQPRLFALTLVLSLAAACGGEPAQPADDATPPAEPAATVLIDQALLADVLGEAIEVTGERVSADGLLVRLAFEPLIRQTGPVSLQLVQSTGYRLLGVAEGSPLWQLGLREGDVLTSVDGQPIVGHEHELRSRWEKRPMSSEIGYLRGDQQKTLSLRVRAGAAWRGTEVVSTLITRPEPSLEPSLEPSSEPAWDSAVRCTPGTSNVLANCEIDRGVVERLRADPTGLLKQVRIVPRTKDGEVSGYKLYGMRASSLPSMLGLQNGDVLVALEGQTLTSIDSTMMAFNSLGPDTGTVRLTIERRGETKLLVVKIADIADATK